MTRIRLLALILVCGSATAARAATVVVFNDGVTHIVDASDSYPTDGAVVQDSLNGDPTEVIVRPGGMFGNSVTVKNTSTFRLEGGDLATFVQAGDNSFLQILSGTVGTGIGVSSGATGLVTGGNIGSDITAAPGGSIDIYGGLIGGSLIVGNGGVINVHGTGFNFPLGPLQPISGSLTGTLSDGTALTVTFNRDFRGEGTITLVPEPASFCILALASLVLARRRLTTRQLQRTGTAV